MSEAEKLVPIVVKVTKEQAKQLRLEAIKADLKSPGDLILKHLGFTK